MRGRSGMGAAVTTVARDAGGGWRCAAALGARSKHDARFGADPRRWTPPDPLPIRRLQDGLPMKPTHAGQST